MSKPNILLIIVDCLRYDYVSPQHMPWLHTWGHENVWCHNHWSSSHCTDPAITHILTGMHPDAIRLYSMMYGDKNYSISGDVENVFQLAAKNGYFTAFVTNLGRWYKWGVKEYVDCRGWPGKRIFSEGLRIIEHCPVYPFFVAIHTDDCHSNYSGGSYADACRLVDGYIQDIVEKMGDNTAIIITSDHGEGLGQAGPDGKPILQHGYGLWDFLTKVPFIASPLAWKAEPQSIMALTSPFTIYRLLRDIILWDSRVPFLQTQVFQAGATPKVFHRGVVLSDGRQFIRATTRDGHERYYVGKFTENEAIETEEELAMHCARYNIDYGETAAEQAVLDRLRGLGYFE